MLAKTVSCLLQLAFVASSVSASFIKEVRPDEYEWQINEHGFNFTQKIRFDEANGFVISEVPRHNGRIATTFYNDQTNGLVLAVSDETKSATIGRAFMGQKIEDQRSVLSSLAQQEDYDSNDRLYANSETVGPSVELIDITGPNIDRRCVPAKYRNFIPKGYPIQLVHQVQKFIGKNVVLNKDDPSQFTIYDPLTQKNYTEGDDINEVYNTIFDSILPPVEGTGCPHHYKKPRTKRSTCRDENRQIIARCTTRLQGDCTTCQSTNVGYDCHGGPGSKCVWVLKCQTINNAACIKHITSMGRSCNPCCLVRGCGSQIRNDGRRVMETCTNIPEDDICPVPGTGCPHAHVRTRHTGVMKHQTCFQDYSCTRGVYINDATGDLPNSGVNCRSVTYDVPEKIFCCDSNDDSLTHSLQRCDDYDAQNGTS